MTLQIALATATPVVGARTKVGMVRIPAAVKHATMTLRMIASAILTTPKRIWAVAITMVGTSAKSWVAAEPDPFPGRNVTTTGVTATVLQDILRETIDATKKTTIATTTLTSFAETRVGKALDPEVPPNVLIRGAIANAWMVTKNRMAVATRKVVEAVVMITTSIAAINHGIFAKKSWAREESPRSATPVTTPRTIANAIMDTQ